MRAAAAFLHCLLQGPVLSGAPDLEQSVRNVVLIKAGAYQDILKIIICENIDIVSSVEWNETTDTHTESLNPDNNLADSKHFDSKSWEILRACNWTIGELPNVTTLTPLLTLCVPCNRHHDGQQPASRVQGGAVRECFVLIFSAGWCGDQRGDQREY